jgi:O-acetyl-ADP-ribose deacetylase (regulator of RNase III)
MLTYLSTSILTSSVQTVVNTVNTVGVMGKGLAADFKKRYPDMFKRYRELCRADRFHVGQLWLWKGPDQWVLNFPTKEHWRNPSQISYIQAGLEKFIESYQERGITEIAFPRLGCGNGGLSWEEVRPLMERYLARLPIRVDIHDHEKDLGLPEHKEVTREEFSRSFESFLAELRQVMDRRGRLFHTVVSGSPFQAFFNEAGELQIQRTNGTIEIAEVSQDDLYEVWTSLLQGPVTEDNLSGRAREEADYLIPLISTLRFVRPLEVRQRNGSERIGIELLERQSRTSIVSEGPSQTGFEWASHES